MDCPARRFPLRRPANHVPPIPRWYAHFANGLDRVFTAYIGIQQHNGLDTGRTQCLAAIELWLAENQNAPAAVERFQVIDGDDAPESLIFVCYWDNESKYEEGIRALNIIQLYQELEKSVQPTVGLWCERFVSHVSRLETNYSGTDYLPGLARLPGTKTIEHSYSAYWGAARDRIPDSAFDLFEQDDNPKAAAAVSHNMPTSLGRHLTGTNFQNMVHIRTGQFWNNCDEDERRSYEDKLEPTLREGLLYLWQNPGETGSMGLRYLTNIPTSSPQWSGQSNESCVTGFFRSLADLETWAKKHPSHLAIYTGAIRHAKTFGDRRKFRTWHEVSVLKRGDAHFEYLNCLPRTGMINCISLTEVSD